MAYYNIRVYKQRQEKETGDWLLSSEIKVYTRKPKLDRSNVHYMLEQKDLNDAVLWYCVHMIFDEPATAVLQIDDMTVNYLHDRLGSSLDGVIEYLATQKGEELLNTFLPEQE